MTGRQALTAMRNHLRKHYAIAKMFEVYPYVLNGRGTNRNAPGAVACLVLAKRKGTTLPYSNLVPTPDGVSGWLSTLTELGRDGTLMLMDLMLLAGVTERE